MHKRVDSVFDHVERGRDGDAIAIIGSLDGKVDVNSEERDEGEVFAANFGGAWAGYAFPNTFGMGEAIRDPDSNAMLTTVVAPRCSVSEVVEAAVYDEDDLAREAIMEGSPERYFEEREESD